MEGDEGGVVDNATTVVEKEVSRPVVLLPAGAQTFSSASPISVVYAFWKGK
jgi:hypothetical protein